MIFIDEAYALRPDDTEQGKRVLDFMLPICTDYVTKDYGKVVWVLAGYRRDMEHLIRYNPGFQSRFMVGAKQRSCSEARSYQLRGVYAPLS